MWDQEPAAQPFCQLWPLWCGKPAERDRRSAVRGIESLADDGYPPAQHALVEAYMNGDGVRRDHGRAFELALAAAESGYPSSQLTVGNYYLTAQPEHDVVELDPEQALHWHRAAAAHGNSGAQYILALSYSVGRGVDQNPVEAHFWATAAVHCAPVRSRPSEVLSAPEADKLTQAQRVAAGRRAAQFTQRWPEPWSEHLTYWRHLAALAGVGTES